MKGAERIKAKKAVDRIQSGAFDELEVESLFMRMRAYSRGNEVFREAADFVAHNNARDKGIINDSIDAIYLAIKFLNEFTAEKQLYFDRPFPCYVLKLLKYKLASFSEAELKRGVGVSRSSIQKILNDGFVDVVPKVYSVAKDRAINEREIEILSFLLSRLVIGEAFSPAELINQLVRVLSSNAIPFSEPLLRANENAVVLCFALLTHLAEFQLSAGGRGSSEITVADNSLMTVVDGVFAPANCVGEVVVSAKCLFNFGRGDIFISFIVFSTGLLARDVCDFESLMAGHHAADGVEVFARDIFSKPLHLVLGKISAA
ncbi:hypothetical protein [Pseudomonas sp. RIT357]|uniref:hypothetical protein n=1 Tax=Pseudomonas sp. RIT357 TaxID=1470593 RepID=UPI000448E9E3|nr:hypothetical protein [Pseudomonas sp. RIT357]EZP62662.1 hypothetical protein BW43_05117 [Pseudomonas sp. RIT357]